MYKKNFFLTIFVNADKLNNYIKNYMHFFLLKKMPIIKILNDYLSFSNLNIKKEGNLFQYQKLVDNFSFNFIFIY
jgi:hypothetical protein